ncbi:N-acetylmuramoyl-L-alanine amidase [Sphingobium sp. H33]|uniref:N-acetylmuramoyl-L-alanine amidase n=1 Tax=Sphingobium nicotianae TaxID=2782607 RepID=A0A9X1DF97_9SPHN|nr:N-acetylmuramoyl-L-alanine amidase [Sphingobium nicotianae]
MVLLAAFLALSAQIAPPPHQDEAAWRPAPLAMTRPPSKSRILVRIPDTAPSIALPPVQGPADKNRPLVVIDAGHGGHDPGAHNPASGAKEKDLTLAIARTLRDELLKTGRIRVALTREDDRFLVLQERYGIARKLGASLFISIHADAADTPSARGATIYTLSDVASDREAARLAARENRADIINGVDLSDKSNAVSSILIDLTQRETMDASARFAELLHREALPHFRFRTPYQRFASLVVLKSPDTPSVLLEAGYISNDEDAAWMATRDGQLQLAKGITAAVSVHFARQSVRR